MRFLPTEMEVKALRQYERERRPLDQLTEEDRFMLLFSKIERLTQRMNIITFVGNFSDNISMLTPQLNAIIAASASVKSSPKLKRMLEVSYVYLFVYEQHLCFTSSFIIVVLIVDHLSLGKLYEQQQKRLRLWLQITKS